jgi:hypothetical protein
MAEAGIRKAHRKPSVQNSFAVAIIKPGRNILGSMGQYAILALIHFEAHVYERKTVSSHGPSSHSHKGDIVLSCCSKGSHAEIANELQVWSHYTWILWDDYPVQFQYYPVGILQPLLNSLWHLKGLVYHGAQSWNGSMSQFPVPKSVQYVAIPLGK